MGILQLHSVYGSAHLIMIKGSHVSWLWIWVLKLIFICLIASYIKCFLHTLKMSWSSSLCMLLLLETSLIWYIYRYQEPCAMDGLSVLKIQPDLYHIYLNLPYILAYYTKNIIVTQQNHESLSMRKGKIWGWKQFYIGHHYFQISSTCLYWIYTPLYTGKIIEFHKQT